MYTSTTKTKKQYKKFFLDFHVQFLSNSPEFNSSNEIPQIKVKMDVTVLLIVLTITKSGHRKTVNRNYNEEP